MHQLEVHHVGLEVGDGVGQLGEGGLEGVEREGGAVALDAAAGRIAEGGAGRGARGAWLGASARLSARGGGVVRFIFLYWSVLFIDWCFAAGRGSRGCALCVAWVWCACERGWSSSASVVMAVLAAMAIVGC